MGGLQVEGLCLDVVTHVVAHSCRWKLNSCTSRLTNLGVTWAVAEAAAKATGANDNAAGDLIFSGAACAVLGMCISFEGPYCGACLTVGAPTCLLPQTDNCTSPLAVGACCS